MVAVAQLVRAPDCGSGGRGFETHQSPILFRCKQIGMLYFPNCIWIVTATKNIKLREITLFYSSFHSVLKVKQKKNLNIFPGRKPKRQYLQTPVPNETRSSFH